MEFEVQTTIAPIVGMTSILSDVISKKYDSINDLNSIKVNAEEENYEDINPVIDSMIEDENNHIGKLQQLIDLLNGSEDDIAEGKAETIELIDNPEIMESMKMGKKLKLNENFDNVIDDVQAVADPVFVGANEEHDENKKKYEDAIKENEKKAKETIPKEGETGKKVTSKGLKSMKLSEELFEDLDWNSADDLRSAVYNALSEIMYEFTAKRDIIVNESDMNQAYEWFTSHFFLDDGSFNESYGKKKFEEGYYVNPKDPIDIFKYYLTKAMLDIEFKRKLNPSKQDLINAFEEWLDGYEFDDDSFDESLKEDLAKGLSRPMTPQENLCVNKMRVALFGAVDALNEYEMKYGESLDPDLIKWTFNSVLSKFLNESLNESFVQEWWGQTEEDPREFARKFGLKVTPVKRKGDETLYVFRGSKEDIERARKAGYFYSLDYGEDAGHSSDLNESLQVGIAKEQIQRFTEGKMPKNWSVDNYLTKLTEKKHITHKEARSLKEWYNTRTKLNESFDWKKSSGNGYLYGYDGSVYTGVVQPNGHSYILERTFSGNDKVIWTKDFNSVEEGRKAVDFVRDKLSKRPLGQKDYEAIEEADKELAQW